MDIDPIQSQQRAYHAAIAALEQADYAQMQRAVELLLVHMQEGSDISAAWTHYEQAQQVALRAMRTVHEEHLELVNRHVIRTQQQLLDMLDVVEQLKAITGPLQQIASQWPEVRDRVLGKLDQLLERAVGE